MERGVKEASRWALVNIDRDRNVVNSAAFVTGRRGILNDVKTRVCVCQQEFDVKLCGNFMCRTSSWTGYYIRFYQSTANCYCGSLFDPDVD
jgi:hypothetical protein